MGVLCVFLFRSQLLKISTLFTMGYTCIGPLFIHICAIHLSSSSPKYYVDWLWLILELKLFLFIPSWLITWSIFQGIAYAKELQIREVEVISNVTASTFPVELDLSQRYSQNYQWNWPITTLISAQLSVKLTYHNAAHRTIHWNWPIKVEAVYDNLAV